MCSSHIVRGSATVKDTTKDNRGNMGAGRM